MVLGCVFPLLWKILERNLPREDLSWHGISEVFRPSHQGGQGGAEWADGDQEVGGSPLLQTSSSSLLPSRPSANGMLLLTLGWSSPNSSSSPGDPSQASQKCSLHAVSRYSQAAVSPSSFLRSSRRMLFESEVGLELDAVWGLCHSRGGGVVFPSEGPTISACTTLCFWCFSNVVTLKTAMSDCC